MFKNPFSFEGRIRRAEFGLSLIFYSFVTVIVNAIMASSQAAGIVGIAYIPMLWFLWAQGAKRCHDVDNSGWWQLIPFYALYLLFGEGDGGTNQYGENPKGIQNPYQPNNTQQNPTTNPQGGYQGDYTGGHNNPNTNNALTDNPQNKDGYKDGDLYK